MNVLITMLTIVRNLIEFISMELSLRQNVTGRRRMYDVMLQYG